MLQAFVRITTSLQYGLVAVGVVECCMVALVASAGILLQSRASL